MVMPSAEASAARTAHSLPEFPSTGVCLGVRAIEVRPVVDAPRLSSIPAEVVKDIEVTDEYGDSHSIQIPIERDLTLVVDGRAIGKLWTLGPQPEWLVVGYLRNRRLIDDVNEIESVSIDWASGTAVVLTRRTYPIDWRVILANSHGDPRSLSGRGRLTRTTLMAMLETMRGNDAIYRAAGSVQACALFCGPELWLSVEDVSRRNCFDVIAGWMALHGVGGNDKAVFSTGRLTAEVVIKAAINDIPVLVTRKGITSACFDLASRFGMTLIGHATPHRYLCYVDAEHFDAES